MDNLQSYITELNNPERAVRLESLRKLKQAIDSGELPRPVEGGHVNNHIHTTYSFSPYSPSKALWMAYNAGLVTAGIIDHDSVGGTEEFIEAGKIIGMATTIGTECRVDFSSTRLAGKKINNPDQDSIAYVTLHGIPHTHIKSVNDFLAPYRAERNKRNRKMVEKINSVLKAYDIVLDFERDVMPLSMCHDGGSITERHILFGLSKKLVEKWGKGAALVDFVKSKMGLNLSQKVEAYLLDTANPNYDYDLLGALKSDLAGLFYINAVEECPDVKVYIDFAKSIGAISAYAYLGDVTNSVTGDKKTQKFEDDYLDILFEELNALGFDGVTYMPSRNTLEQLKRVKGLCAKYGLFEISGEDINSPRQSFVCEAMKNKEFENLIDSTWALIGHEKVATLNTADGMFSTGTKVRYPELTERIKVYREIGLKR